MNEALENDYESISLELSDSPSRSAESDPLPSETLPKEGSESPPQAHSVEAPPDPPVSELDSLRAEISELRELLRAREEGQIEALREIEDFRRLFPHVAPEGIPESVRSRRNGGIPLSAAYALYERELAIQQEAADQINRSNAARSAGRAGIDAAAEYFSPDEVRAMSPRQVRKHYQTIRESMKKWN